jgi:Winged helix-turn helix
MLTVRLAVRTTGKYLARWGFTAQKPLRRAYEQNPAEVRHWLRHDPTWTPKFTFTFLFNYLGVGQ